MMWALTYGLADSFTPNVTVFSAGVEYGTPKNVNLKTFWNIYAWRILTRSGRNQVTNHGVPGSVYPASGWIIRKFSGGPYGDRRGKPIMGVWGRAWTKGGRPPEAPRNSSTVPGVCFDFVSVELLRSRRSSGLRAQFVVQPHPRPWRNLRAAVLLCPRTPPLHTWTSHQREFLPGRRHLVS